MIQIILRDLSPILYVPPGKSAYMSLQAYNSNAYDRITVQDAMRVWHPDLNRLYYITKDLDHILREIESEDRRDFCEFGETPTESQTDYSSHQLGQPKVGIPVMVPLQFQPIYLPFLTILPFQTPKSERPGIPSVATRNLEGLVAVETKYDGERLVLHRYRV